MRRALGTLLSLVPLGAFASPDDDLLKAIENRDVAAVAVAIEQGAAINGFEVDGRFRVPLSAAAAANDVEIVATLLRAGADPNVYQLPNSVPMHWAVNSDTRILALVLEAGGDPDVAYAFGDTALHRVAACRMAPYVELTRQGYYRGTPPNCLASLRLLLDAGANLEARGMHEETPLQRAVFWNNVDTAETLVLAGANIETTDVESVTPLLSALQKYASQRFQEANGGTQSLGDYLPMIERLLKLGANPNTMHDKRFDSYADAVTTPYTNGYTPLTLAGRHGWLEVTQLLLRHGADRNGMRADGRTPRQLAGKYGHGDIVELLDEYAAGDPNQATN